MNKANRRWEKDPEYKGGYRTVSDVGPVTPVRVYPPKPDGTVEIQAWYTALGEEGTANIGAVKWYANRLLEATALAEMLWLQQESNTHSEDSELWA